MAALTTSNLPVKSIINTLGVAKAKDIFYEADGTLRSELESMVNKWGLSSYCPGTSSISKLANLKEERKLSYFKGYNHLKEAAQVLMAQIVSSDGGVYDINVMANNELSWTAYVYEGDWIMFSGETTGQGNGVIKLLCSSNMLNHPRQAVVKIVFSDELGLKGSGNALFVQLTQNPALGKEEF